MTPPAWLGAPVRTYRPRLPIYDALYFSAIPVGLLIGGLFAEGSSQILMFALVPAFAVLCLAWVAWSASAVLVLHQHGILVGRRLGTLRAIPYLSIHPASIATYTSITDIVSGIRPVVWPHWYIFIGSKDAVSFVGPAQETVAGPGYVPPPVPDKGFVLFATPRAAELAHELRRALISHGVPVHLARWSEHLSPVELDGAFVSSRRDRMPGHSATWRP